MLFSCALDTSHAANAESLCVLSPSVMGQVVNVFPSLDRRTVLKSTSVPSRVSLFLPSSISLTKILERHPSPSSLSTHLTVYGLSWCILLHPRHVHTVHLHVFHLFRASCSVLFWTHLLVVNAPNFLEAVRERQALVPRRPFRFCSLLHQAPSLHVRPSGMRQVTSVGRSVNINSSAMCFVWSAFFKIRCLCMHCCQAPLFVAWTSTFDDVTHVVRLRM